MKDVVGLSHREMADIYSEWNRGDLDSFLIEITANILKYKVSIFTYYHWHQIGLKSGGAGMRIRDLFSKIRDLFSNTRLRDQKNSRCS